MMNRVLVLASLVLATPILGAPVGAQLKVVTSTTDLADIAKQVGGAKITVSHVSEGYQDPHFAEAKPSFILRMRDADVFAFVGLDLEIGWLPLLLQGARNTKIQMGGSGYLDVSQVISVLDRPSGNVDRSQGDVHPLGNPHYWLDPENGRRIARLFKDKFSQLDPKNEDDYEKNEKAFEARLNNAERAWGPEVRTLKGQPVVAYHTSWKYLAEYTGLNIVGFMEPKPGVPPSPSHLAGLIMQMKRTGAKAIIMEPFYNRKDADFVSSKTGAKVVIMPPSVGGLKGQKIDDYIDLMKFDIDLLANSLK
jgi:ABC-type Zn uptake system ZnuABC Zn-binding protein ZnuA